MRKSVERVTRLRSSACVSWSWRKLSRRDQSPTYGAGGHCACIAPSRSTAAGTERCERSSRSWRASVARLSALAVKGGKAPSLVVELPSRLPRYAFERAESDLPALVAPGARHLPVQQKRVERVRRLRVEDQRPVLLGKDPGAARVDEQRGVPDGQEPRRRRRFGLRERRTRQVDELFPGLVPEAPQREPFERRRHLGDA